MSTKATFKQSLYAFIFSVFTLHPVWADDTEIFFGSNSDAASQPNLLFVLDGSGSMGWYDCANGDIDKNAPCDDGSVNGNSTRLERMVNAMGQVLDGTSNVNVGLMRFSHGYSGARVTYPLSDIDKQFCNDAPCDEYASFISQSSVSASSDDAYEDENGVVVMDVPYVPTTLYDGDKQSKIVGIRFPELKIPQGASIEDARIEFTSLTTTDTPSTLTFRVEDTAHSEPFEAVDGNISNRNWWNNQIDWASPEWETDNTFGTNNLQPFLQRIVQKTNWCGGNAVGIAVTGDGADFLASSYDRRANDGPVLRVTFRLNNVPPTGGCTIAETTGAVSNLGGDVLEDLTGNVVGKIRPNNKNVRVDHQRMSGLSFEDIIIPPGAQIKEARIKLQINDKDWQNTGDQSIDIALEDNAAPAIFSTAYFNVSNRSKTPAIEWKDVPGTLNSAVQSDDISTLVQSIINKPDWSSGNRINAILTKNSNSANGSRRGFVAYDKNSAIAAKLHVSYYTRITETAQLVSGPVTDVRAKVKEQLKEMVANGGTPTVGAMYEAQRYFAGDNVYYGKLRCNPAEWWCKNRGVGRYSRVSHPQSYTGGNLVRADNCRENNLNSADCSTEQITETPRYLSPIQHECQSNHVIILTDGEPTSDDEAAKSAGLLAVGGSANCAATIKGGQCGAELAAYMQTADFDLSRPGTQNITTHTIGFNFETPWLESLAHAGGGGYYTANSADDLIRAVTDIVSNVKNIDTTFVSPGATIDNFSRLSHRKDVYLALFQPSLEPGWKGNLKKYELRASNDDPLSTPTLYDAKGNPAVNNAEGVFKEGAQSFWSEPVDDGNDTLLGGAASKLLPANRKLVTYIDGSSDTALFNTMDNTISANNGMLTNQHMGALTDAERLDMIEWLYGVDVTDENGDGDDTDNRNHIGDPLHSKPVLVTYGGTEAEPDSVVFFGTNEGALHGISTISGEEVFAYYPIQLMKNLNVLYNRTRLPGIGERLYGVDGDLTLVLTDNNKNGVIETGDKAIIYAGLRRGGRDYFSLDVSDKNNPKFKANIIGGSNSMPELGESWSKPIVSKIKVGTDLKNVLIFAGGYDNAQDNNTTRKPDTMGRAIYIIDAENPSIKYWVGSINPVGATEEFPDMSYSIPSNINVVTKGDNKLASQLYVGDMGGRIWRFDINNGQSGKDLVDGGIIADLSEDGKASETRRFYHPPDISLSRINGKKYVNIAVGSGYQAHPLNTQISDKFFLIRYPFKATGNYGMPKENDNTAFRAITLGDLYDTTQNLIGQGDTAQIVDDAIQELKSKQGWYLTMEDSGEKILGPSSTLNGVIRFISYLPGFETVDCGPNIGRSRLWAVNLSDATPDTTSIAKGIDNPVKENRYEDVPGAGIAPPVQTLFVETGNTVTPAVLSGANVLWEGDENRLMRRWYWAEQPD